MRSALWVLVLAGCGARTGLPAPDGESCADAGATRACETICGTGEETCSGGVWKGCTAPRPRDPMLVGTLRDFRDDHPDFEGPIGDDRGIVLPALGTDDKPAYASSSSTLTTTGKHAFDQWFRDVPGVNLSQGLVVELSRAKGSRLWVYDSPAFFPLDGQLFGNQGREHNYHFTFEVATEFRYQGGEVFAFTGDDDLWVFVNRRLALDLGGVHSAESASVELDAAAAELGIEPGGIYPLHFFFAERHTSQSRFRVSTSIAEFLLCE